MPLWMRLAGQLEPSQDALCHHGGHAKLSYVFWESYRSPRGDLLRPSWRPWEAPWPLGAVLRHIGGMRGAVLNHLGCVSGPLWEP